METIGESDRIRILLVEDEIAWQQAIEALVGTVEHWGVVGFADNFPDAMVSFEESKPDVVLLDWQIKGYQDGLAVGEAMVEHGFPVERIILVSGAEQAMIPQHPYGYVPKHLIASRLIPTIQRVTKS